LGYFAKENHTCCNSCGWSDVPDVQYDKVIFYHNQDLDSLKESQGCYLSWSGKGKEIVDVLERNGLKVKWNGKDNARIHIQIVQKNVETREIINCKLQNNLK